MSDIISFIEGIQIKSGVTFEELVKMLQTFTVSHLYIDNGLLYSISNMENVNYEVCDIIEFGNGYYLREKYGKKRYIHVFSKELMLYLIEEESSEEEQEEMNEEQEEQEEQEEEPVFTEFQSYYSQKLEDVPLESTLESTSDSIESYNKELSESDESTEEIEYKELIKTNFKEKTWFRMFFRENDEDLIYIDELMFEDIEKKHSINLVETIENSFSHFLKSKGFECEAFVTFFKDIYGEVYIETKLPLTNESINQIEETKLKLSNCEITFVLKNIHTHISFSDTIISNSDESIETFYNDEISISNLPVELVEKILSSIDKIELKGEKLCIEYESGRFIVEYEGGKLYTVFDYDSILQLPHLKPNFYSNISKVEKFSELPVARFYYFN